MKNEDTPAMPLTGDAYTDFSQYDCTSKTSYNPECQGLTKREEILARFMSAMLSNPEMDYNYTTNGDGLAQDAMKFVDSYFKALEEK